MHEMETADLVDVWGTGDKRPWTIANARSIEETAQFKLARGSTRVKQLRGNGEGEQHVWNCRRHHIPPGRAS
jgi:hypothetical protein